MQNIQGVGGVFFRAKDAESLARWYSAHLGLAMQNWGEARGVAFESADGATTVFSIFQCDDQHPVGPRSFRVNLRVRDLDGMCERLETAGVALDRESDETFGRFARFEDPEGNELELWEPPAASG